MYLEFDILAIFFPQVAQVLHRNHVPFLTSIG
jgi:hypothetical protein